MIVPRPILGMVLGERAILGVVLAGDFLANSDSFVARGPHCDVETSS